jgi:hypothetical protein
MRKILAAVLFAVLPGLALSHYYFVRPIVNPVSTTSTTTGTATAPVVTTQWRCITAAGATVLNGGPFTTKAAAEAPCGVAVSAAAPSATPTHYLEESVITTTNVPTQTTVRTRRDEVYGGNTIRVADAHAQFIGMQRGGTGPFDTAASDFPDLQALYDLAWSETWPTAPTTTSSATVTPATLAASQAVDGRAITLSAGSYGSITISGSHQRYIVQGSVTIGVVDFTAAADHIVFEFETPRDATSIITRVNMASGASDILIDGVLGDDTTVDAFNRLEGSRVALIRSHLQSATYGLWSDQRSYDVIVWNNIIEGGQQSGGFGPQSLIRVTDVERFACLDNRLVKHAVGKLVRIYTLSNADCSYNQIEAADSTGNNAGNELQPGTDATTPVQAGSTYFRHNVVYNDSGGPMQSYLGGSGEVSDNVSYSGGSWPAAIANWTSSNNTVSSYTAPAAWEFYEDR